MSSVHHHHCRLLFLNFTVLIVFRVSIYQSTVVHPYSHVPVFCISNHNFLTNILTYWPEFESLLQSHEVTKSDLRAGTLLVNNHFRLRLALNWLAVGYVLQTGFQELDVVRLLVTLFRRTNSSFLLFFSIMSGVSPITFLIMCKFLKIWKVTAC